MWVLVHKLEGLSAVLTAAAVLLWRLTGAEGFLTLALLFLTLLYHMVIRALAANLINGRMHNHANLRAAWFRVSAREMGLYRRLKVGKWKGRLPTYDPESFNVKTHSWREIAETTCQSEVVHETNLLLNLLPLTAVRRVGRLWLFLPISLFLGAAELLFILMQRYNRGRILHLLERQEKALNH